MRFLVICLLFAISVRSDVPGTEVTVFTGDVVIRDTHAPFGDEHLEHCSVPKWNNRTTNAVPYENLHRKWAELNKGLFPNLADAQLRVIAAFVYHHEIIVTTTSQNRFGKPVFCRYFDCHRKELNGTAWETIMYPISAAFCARRAGAEFMSLTDDPDGEVLGEPVPLVVRVAEKYTHEIGVCVGPIYGNESRWLEIAETTEHHLLMGANFFYYTILNKMNEYTRKLVDEYERLGYFEVTVIQNEYQTMDWTSHQLQIHDCHFRSRYHSKWVLNVDIDERLVMLKTPLPQFVRSLSPNVGEVIFSVKRVMRIDPLPEKFENREQLVRELEYLKYNMTTKAMFDVPKIMFRPEKVQSLFYHWTYGQYPGVQVMAVSKNYAYVRHYRTTMTSLLGIWYQANEFEVTRMDAELEAKVTEAVVRRVESVYNVRPIRCEEMRQDLMGFFSKDNYDCVYRDGKRYVDVAEGD